MQIFFRCFNSFFFYSAYLLVIISEMLANVLILRNLRVLFPYESTKILNKG